MNITIDAQALAAEIARHLPAGQTGEWMNARECAEHLKIHVRTLDELTVRGLPFVRISGSEQGPRRFFNLDVDEWMRRQG